MRISPVLLLAAATVATGCMPSPFDGTWLFFVDMEPTAETGTCMEGVEDTTTYDGTYNMLVDIYTTDDGGIVVLMEEALYGMVDGSTFDAGFEYVETDEGEVYSEGYDVDGTRDGATLSGSITSWYTYTDGTNTEDCSSTWSYTAERNASDGDRYLE